VQFSSNFFDLDALFLRYPTFSQFLRKVLQSAGIFLWKICSFRLLARRLLISKISDPQFASSSFKNSHYRDYRCHLTIAVFFAISSAFVVLLRAVLLTLIGRGLCDK
jgi:hypothetical protein